MSLQLTIDLPEQAFSMLRTPPDTFIKEMRLAAAVKWFEIGQVSELNAAELAGISRQQFIEALPRYQVSASQRTPPTFSTDSHHRQSLLEQANEAYAKLRNNPPAWKEELNERSIWETTLSDGLEDNLL
jgi:predicted HTH domain antitoxin